jgi:hypothetical protein
MLCGTERKKAFGDLLTVCLRTATGQKMIGNAVPFVSTLCGQRACKPFRLQCHELAETKTGAEWRLHYLFTFYMW